ncbi:MAG TPA: maleylpyruvate isomerase family mycothiol-dependent enzyme, partial [Actinopolymorphaceae bacterium]|nr:maleylpyruvate isomerase family mycothiol-dependent enzyme [Actinopolymorphaceae bacterium]
MASKGIDAPVPPCPGWTVDDVVSHVAHVYLHKIVCMQTQARPDPWPPDLSGRESVGLLQESFATLLDEMRTRGPDAPSFTWYEPDQSVGFWYRRMAQETAIHRVDVELAHEMLTPVDAELAADGIDEVLSIMLAGDWSDEPVDDADGRSLDVLAGGRRWRVVLGRTQVDVAETTPGFGTAGATSTSPGQPSTSPGQPSTSPGQPSTSPGQPSTSPGQ